MRIDKYYDVCCESCYKHLSTDFGKGFAYTRQEAIEWAREVGFKTVQGKFICPACCKILKIIRRRINYKEKNNG